MTQHPPDEPERTAEFAELKRRHETLMRGLELLSQSGAQTGPRAVVELLDDLLGGDGGAVLQVRDDGELTVLCASDPRLEKLQWWVGDLTEAVLEGSPLMLDDVRGDSAWQSMLGSVSMPVASVMMMSVGTPVNPALWLCVHAEPGRFGQIELERAQTLRGLLTQAMVGWMAGRRWAMMSHELRTPVNAMIGYAELLGEEQRQRLPDDALDKLARIEQSGAEVLGIVSNLVSLAQLEAGDVETEVQRIEVNATLDAVLSQLHRVATRRNVEVSIDIGQGDFAVQSDAEKLHQLLIGVIGEAVRFTAASEVSITLQSRDEQLLLEVIEDRK